MCSSVVLVMVKMSLKICVLFSISTAIAEMTPSPIVEIVQGKIKGSVWKDYDGKDFYSFLGIPYAKPPLGDLRFKPSVPADPWCGVRDATNEGNRCYSRHDRTGVMGGSEDCLNLNIYTRTLPHEDNRLKPVMVYIHGGGFVEGCNSPKSYGPEFLITEDIVLVVMNYRIGIFGFLCLKDPSLDIPGNNGMKDQVLALKWVRGNIEKFNGDPNNVTIFGNSAGGVSVHYLMLSPMAKGLFHRAILQSGSAFNYWAEGDWVASTIAKHLGVKVDSEKKALEVIKNATTEELGKAREKMQGEFKPANRRFFGVVVEYPNPTAFLTKPPMEIISSGEYNKVPMMAGFNSREGILLLGAGPLSEINPEDHIPWQMEIKKGSKTSEEICKKMKDYYLEGENKEDIFLLPTDSMFLAGITAMIQHHLTNLQKPLYMYRVSLEAELNLLRKMLNFTSPGVCHADELGYLFKSDQTTDVERGSIEDISIRRFVKLWTNFAKFGNPTPNEKEFDIIWEPVEKEKTYFLDIGNELSLDVEPEKERMELWKEIFDYSPVTKGYL